MKRREEIPALTGIRGIAASVVVLAHGAVIPMPFAGLAVAVFFVLSGFVLAHVYRDGTPPGAFFRARAARTLPVHLATTAIVAVSVGATWQQTAAAALGIGIINPPVWSLIVEWYAYTGFAAFGDRILSGKAALLLALGLISISLGLQAFGIGLDGIFHKVGGWGRVPEGLGEFAAGVALYRLGYRPRATWLTDNRLALWLGEISYPLYLCHLIPAYWLCSIAGLSPGTAPLSMPWPMAAACFTLPILLATVLHYTVEGPCRRIIRKRVNLDRRAIVSVSVDPQAGL